jgi:bifunctional DNase/RNase
MRLRRIVLCELQDAHSITLLEVDGARHLSMVVGLFEAKSIDHRVRHIQTPRPLTHDLIGGVIDILGGELPVINTTSWCFSWRFFSSSSIAICLVMLPKL